MTDFIAELKYTTAEQGGRSMPAFSNYRPQIKFEIDEMRTCGQQIFIGRDKVYPGESVKAKIQITGVQFFKNRLEEGMNFEFLEGAILIGTGKILTILNKELKKG